MGCKERVLEEIGTVEQRAVERRASWQTISDSFESEGADVVTNELNRQMANVQKRFDAVLAKLRDTL